MAWQFKAGLATFQFNLFSSLVIINIKCEKFYYVEIFYLLNCFQKTMRLTELKLSIY